VPRKPRICFTGAFYHITCRGDNQERIFFNASDRRRFLRILSAAKHKFNFNLHAFVLMRNHFHLLIETSAEGTASKIMHSVNGNYTKCFNYFHKRSGHLFQGRFHSVLVNRDAYLLEVSRYIHLNPLRAGIVKFPEEHKWSSYHFYVGLKTNSLLSTDLILSLMNQDTLLQKVLYKNFVYDGINKNFSELRSKLYHDLLR
jgi:REP element-mobilizing transposase RayT